jgi:hypothetical protein
LRSPLHFTNLNTSGGGSEPLSSSRLPIPQNSPEDVRHTTPLILQTPPVTTFFSSLTSQIEKAVQQIVSPNKQRHDGSDKEENVLASTSEVELQNLSNVNEPLGNLDFLRDTTIRNLFSTTGLSPYDEIYNTDGLYSIRRPIRESLNSLINCFLVTSTPHIYRSINGLNWEQNQKENNEGLVEPDSSQHEQIHPFESTPSLPEIQNVNQTNNKELDINGTDEFVTPEISLLPIDGNDNQRSLIEEGVIDINQRNPPSSSSSSSLDPPTPPLLPIQNLDEPVPMAQPQRLLNIAPFPYFYGRLGTILMHMWIDF